MCESYVFKMLGPLPLWNFCLGGVFCVALCLVIVLLMFWFSCLGPMGLECLIVGLFSGLDV